jgi:AraC-like DNA-binding protein
MAVSVTLVRALAEEVARAGRDPDAFLRAADLDRATLSDPDARLPFARYHRLQELALAWCGDPALGLHIGERAPLHAFHVVGFVCAQCGTLREAIAALARYGPLLFDVDPPTLDEDGGEATLRYRFTYGNGTSDRMGAEFAIAATVQVGRMGLGRVAAPTGVAFEHPAPAYVAEYARVFGAPVRFDAPATAIGFDRALLDAPLLHANPDLHRVLASEAERKLSALAVAPLRDRVRAMVLEEDEGGRSQRPSMDAVARRLGLSERSLRRRLRAEGATFAAVVETAIAEAARRRLRDRRATIKAVADELGFSEASAFHRAFKRWTGMTPQQFREDAAAEASRG